MPGVSDSQVPRSRLELLAEFYERAGQDAADRRDFETACRCRKLAIALNERAIAERRALLNAQRAEFDANLRTQNATPRPHTGAAGRPVTRRNGHRPRAMTRTGDNDDSGSDSDSSDSDQSDDPAPGVARASFVWWTRR